MPCETCNAQFNLFKRKKCCSECKRLYCNQCVIKRNEYYLCDRCVVFIRRPISKVELLQLKPKDLIFYLQSKHISTTGCVEKEELVNLVINHAHNSATPNTTENCDGGSSVPNSYESSNNTHNNTEKSSSNALDNLKQTCQNIFTNFTEKIATDLNFDLNSSSSGQNQNIFSQPRASSRPAPPTASTSPTINNVGSNNSTINNSINSSHNNPPLPINRRNKEQPRIHQQSKQHQQQNIHAVPNIVNYSSSIDGQIHQANNNSGSTQPLSDIFSDNQPNNCINSMANQNVPLSTIHTLNQPEQSQVTTTFMSPLKLCSDSGGIHSSEIKADSSQSSGRCIGKNNGDYEPDHVLLNHDCDCSDDELFTNFKKSYNNSEVTSPVSDDCLLSHQLASLPIPLLQISVTPISLSSSSSSSSSQQQSLPPLRLPKTQIALKLPMELDLADDEQNETTAPEKPNDSSSPSESLSVGELGVRSLGTAPNINAHNSSCSNDIQIDDDNDADVNIIKNSVESENWQFINSPVAESEQSSQIDQNGFIQEPQPTTSTTMQTSTNLSFSNLEDNISILPGTSTEDHVTGRTIPKKNDGFECMPPTSEATNKKNRFSCDKCGKNKNMNLQRHVEKFRRQLESYNISEPNMKEQLEAFLSYLEIHYNRSSFEQSDSDSGGDGGVATPPPPPPPPSSSNVHHENRVNITDHSIISPSGSITEFITVNEGEVNETFSYNVPTDFDDDIEFLYGDHEGIHVYGTEDPNSGYTGPTRQFVNLNDFSSSDELDDLSVKQLKEILMLNRVDFKGCCEKKELLERVERLWNEYNSSPAVDKLPSDDLCKICMDAPIECVILECGHMTTCTNCGKVLSECPICRQYITRVVRFFRA